jgi:hypothetical protein
VVGKKQFKEEKKEKKKKKREKACSLLTSSVGFDEARSPSSFQPAASFEWRF